MLGRDRGEAGEVGDRAGHPERPIVAASREAEPRHGCTHETGAFGSERAEAPEQTRAHLGVDAQARPVEPLTLALARDQHAGPNRRRAGPAAAPLELGGLEGRQLHLQVDPVQQGAGEAPEITVALGRRAEASLERWTAAAAGVGGRHEQKACGEVTDAGGPSADELAKRTEYRATYTAKDAPPLLGPPGSSNSRLSRPLHASAANAAAVGVDLVADGKAEAGTAGLE